MNTPADEKKTISESHLPKSNTMPKQGRSFARSFAMQAFYQWQLVHQCFDYILPNQLAFHRPAGQYEPEDNWSEGF